MLFFISYNSSLYVDVKSPITPDWAFFMFLSVPRLITEQCSTVLFISVKQS